MSTEPDPELLGFDAEYDQPAATGRPQPRHARPRSFPKPTTLLGGALAVAVGLAFYMWLQLDSERSAYATVSSSNSELTDQMAADQARLAELEAALASADEQAGSASEELAAAAQQVADAEALADSAESAAEEAIEQRQALETELVEVRRAAESVASAILGTVDPVDACVRATGQLAQHADGLRRGQFRREAERVRDVCAEVETSLAPALPIARDLLNPSP